MKKGFTLLELIIVIIVVGILASLGFGQYTQTIEKGRAAEARSILGSLRTLQAAYYLENGAYTATIADLGIANVPSSCTSTHYFSYACATTGTCTATRCQASGKSPQSSTAYNKTLTIDGTFGGTTGY